MHDPRPTRPAARCPGCAAAVRPGAPWCTQCFTDLRRCTDLRSASAAVAPVAVAPRSPAPAPEPATAAPSWPCAACGTPNAVDLGACGGCGAGFLAGLSDAGALLVLPVVGDVGRLGKAQRLALAAAVALALVLLTLLLGVLAR